MQILDICKLNILMVEKHSASSYLHSYVKTHTCNQLYDYNQETCLHVGMNSPICKNPLTGFNS